MVWDIYEAGNDGSIFRLSVIVAGWPVFIDFVYRAKWPLYLRFIIHCGSFDIAKLARRYIYMYIYFTYFLVLSLSFFLRSHFRISSCFPSFSFLFDCSNTINRLESMK